MRRFVFILWVLILGLTAFSSTALAQLNMLVEPMIIDVRDYQPGKTYELSLDVRNTNAERELKVELVLTGLGQSQNGSWQPMEMGGNEEQYSCVSWVTLPADQMTVPPVSTEKVPLKVKVPRDARGSYFASLLVRTVPERKPDRIPLVLQFAVPLLFSVNSTKLPSKGEVIDAGISLEEGKQVLWCTVQNDSQKMVSLGGNVVLYMETSKGLRRLRQENFKEKKLLPHKQLRHEFVFDDPLPPREFLLKSHMELDGRRLRAFQKKVTAPATEGKASELLVRFTPETVEINAPAGGKRNKNVQVTNSEGGEVTVQLSFASLDLYKSEETKRFSATDMVSVSPTSFTLAPMRHKNIRVIADRPESTEDQPYLYTMLIAKITDSTGQISARKEIPIIVSDKKSQTALPVLSLEDLSLKDTDAGKVIASKITNVGDIPAKISLNAGVFDTSGKVRMRIFTPSMVEVSLYPLGSQQFTVPIDIEGLEPGAYTLQVGAKSGKAHEEKFLPIEVIANEQGNEIKLINTP